ncbi:MULTISPECIES: hypothetical protein [Subtercola]|uniref:Lipoprotein n=1 Tax=Subtercola vilae TaxID=2056433 RepID=A0A4T2BUL5_9MICO|nr:MULTISPECIES: hypothetical protein [Subtercola]MEA9986478.1 hypothetical protein [Subtercola sp. RTI3]TIH33476.1 hypothetical protein D4765_14870 [Subtercola vilae]
MKRRVLITLPIVAASALMLSACGIADTISPPIQSALYETTADAAGASGSLVLPSFVEADATQIRLVTLDSRNAAIMTYAVPAVVATGEACTPDQMAKLPVMDQTWWPQALPDHGITCSGDWHLWAAGNQFYAWKS